MELLHFSHDHILLLNEKNNLDLDEEISSLCFICSLPIFSTPYYSCSTGCSNFFLHKRCVHIPHTLEHFTGDVYWATVATGVETDCDRCGRKCGNVTWKTFRYEFYSRELDAFCAAPLGLRIFHGSHEHVMIPVHAEDTFVCEACGLKHEDQIRGRIFYWCFGCRFRIHENCATLPNYIRHIDHHDHPLALTYVLPRGDEYSYCCGICGDAITSLGIYFCGMCSYYVHIKCATHRSELYKPVSSREIAESDYWIQFPIANEDESIVAYILEKTRYQNNKESIDSNNSNSSSISNKHEHPLIFRETIESLGRALCNGCIQPISPPYYSCSQCTNYLLHESCANLLLSITHPSHMEHPLVLTTHEKSKFLCNGCGSGCNGFSYHCDLCNFDLDVLCAFLPKSITHKAHHRRHVLHLSDEKYYRTYLYKDCCGLDRAGEFFYACTGCDFAIHALCATLPMLVRHKYDKHPLKLIAGPATTTDRQDNYFEEQKFNDIAATEQQQPCSDENFCEFCEEEIDNKNWYYDCNECNQSFHVDCIPTVARNYKIKLQATLKIPSHPHPLTGIQLLTDVSRNSECGRCEDTIRNFKDGLAFDCLECNFTIHAYCAYRDLHAEN